MWSPGAGLAPDPGTALHIRASVEASMHAQGTVSGPHAIVATAAMRPILADFFEQMALRVDVFAYTEVPSDVTFEPAGIIDAPAFVAA